MAFGNSTVNDFSGAASDIFSGILSGEADSIKAQGLAAEAGEYTMAAKLAGENATVSEESTGIQSAAIQRNFEKVSGTSENQIAGGGFTNSGSALDIIRSNAQQGGIAKGAAEIQGSITTLGYEEQQQSYTAMAAAATAAANEESSLGGIATAFGFATGAIKGAAGLATLAL